MESATGSVLYKRAIDHAIYTKLQKSTRVDANRAALHSAGGAATRKVYRDSVGQCCNLVNDLVLDKSLGYYNSKLGIWES